MPGRLLKAVLGRAELVLTSPGRAGRCAAGGTCTLRLVGPCSLALTVCIVYSTNDNHAQLKRAESVSLGISFAKSQSTVRLLMRTCMSRALHSLCRSSAAWDASDCMPAGHSNGHELLLERSAVFSHLHHWHVRCHDIQDAPQCRARTRMR